MKQLHIALVDEMTSENLKGIAADGAEVALDAFLVDGIFKDIPFFGTLYKGSQAALGIKDAIFAKMVFKFLFELKDIPVEKRKEFIEKLENKEGYSQKVGEKLIVIIDKLDDLDKPTILGKLFKSCVEESISFDDFLRISGVIQRAYLPDLLFLKKHRHLEYYKPGIREHLLALGLIRLDIEDNTRNKQIKEMATIGGGSIDVTQKIKFELNILGEEVRRFLLNIT